MPARLGISNGGLGVYYQSSLEPRVVVQSYYPHCSCHLLRSCSPRSSLTLTSSHVDIGYPRSGPFVTVIAYLHCFLALMLLFFCLFFCCCYCRGQLSDWSEIGGVSMQKNKVSIEIRPAPDSSSLNASASPFTEVALNPRVFDIGPSLYCVYSFLFLNLVHFFDLIEYFL